MELHLSRLAIAESTEQLPPKRRDPDAPEKGAELEGPSKSVEEVSEKTRQGKTRQNKTRQDTLLSHARFPGGAHSAEVAARNALCPARNFLWSPTTHRHLLSDQILSAKQPQHHAASATEYNPYRLLRSLFFSCVAHEGSNWRSATRYRQGSLTDTRGYAEGLVPFTGF